MTDRTFAAAIYLISPWQKDVNYLSRERERGVFLRLIVNERVPNTRTKQRRFEVLEPWGRDYGVSWPSAARCVTARR